jgi:hypothetical protein
MLSCPRVPHGRLEVSLLTCCLRPHRCLTLVSRQSRASPLFVPRRQCRAASPASHPCAQVPELLLASVMPPHPPPASARLCSGEDRASPPVSTTLSLSLLSGSSWSSKPSRVGSMMSSGCHRQDLIDSRSAFASQQPRHSQRSTREPRVGVALVHALATRKHAASWAASAS